MLALTNLVGAVLIARAVDDPALSDEILETVRGAVKSVPSEVPATRLASR